MTSAPEQPEKTLPPPWDRIFSLASKTFVWGLLLAILWLLRPFLLLIFLTFVFAYIQAHGVDGLAHRIKNRVARVVIVGLVVLGTLFATGFTLTPLVHEETNKFLKNKDKYVDDADAELDKFLRQYPSIYTGLAKHKGQGIDPSALAVDPNPKEGQKPPDETPTDPKETPKDGKTGQDPKPDKPETTEPVKPPEPLHLVRELLASATKQLTENPLEIVQSGLGYASSFLLSLLFSFLIVLDLPKLKNGIRGLSKTKIGFFYDEVADNIAGFGAVLGRALEAQLFIALVNTILTSIGVWMMGLDNVLVLATIVFFCSFIPVVGTFISSTPICLLALQAGGVSSMVLAVVLICVIHAIETYILNPQIYGHHMHMNPVLVLIVLTIGGKLFGVWGLLLGIPVVNYVFRHAIRHPAERPAET
ncbi:MAG: AI-2E family transporter [Planctomycetes bacterium]|nr:AI-2E family transporter [Planctomycetota bacterium]